MLLLVLLCLSFISMAQMQLPTKAMGKPAVFLDEQKSYTWEDVAEKQNWGELTDNFWEVYIDRDGAKSYKTPSASANNVENYSLEFMHPYFVAKTQGGFALLYEEKDVQKDLTISKKAKAVGWVPVKHLLLWSSCLRTEGQVCRKAIIVIDPYSLQKVSDYSENNISPKFSNSPTESKNNDNRVSAFEFYYIYKTESNGAVLLFQDNKFSNSVKKEISKKGWMKAGMCTLWDNRLCYEPNYNLKEGDYMAAVFRSQKAARNYKINSGNEVDKEDITWIEKLPNKRWDGMSMRFPVVDVHQQFIVEVSTIGSFVANKYDPSENKKIREKNEELERQKREIEEKLQRINVCFVIDGTSSMKEYYPAVAKAIQAAMDRNEMRGADMHYSAVIYRNYADGDRLIEVKQQVNYKTLSTWLMNNVQCKSVGTSNYEAMWYGLDYAISNIKWDRCNSNFLILIGDAANKPNDAKGLTIEKIAQKMAAKDINFIALQTNHMNHSAYHEFAIQTKAILKKELSILTGKNINMGRNGDFKRKGHVYSYDNTRGLKLHTSAFRFADISVSENPNDIKTIIEEQIIGFKNQALKLRNNFLILANDGGNPKGVTINGHHLNPEAVYKELKGIGASDEFINGLRERGVNFRLKGYTSRTTNDKEVFLPCIFMTKSELNELIQKLKQVSKSETDNRRQDLQNALKILALSYLGQIKDVDNITLEDVAEAMIGVTKVAGGTAFERESIRNIKIKDITEKTKVKDKQIEAIVNDLSNDVNHLESQGSRCKFTQNGNTYYYILLSDMPFQEHTK